MADGEGWDASFMQAIGLEDLVAADGGKIGREAREPGRTCGAGKEIA